MSSPAPPSKSGADREQAWTIAQLLASMQTFLTSRHVDSARLDAEVLLSHVLQVDRIYLYTHFDKPITSDERDILRACIKRRAMHEPIAYICGHKEFYSRAFKVTHDVLIPRPETEHVVESVLGWVGTRIDAPLRVLDVGTGSGALAITLAKELPNALVFATDISDSALAIARDNAQTHGVLERMHFAQGDLFAALDAAGAPFDIIVSNPPYIAQAIAQTLPEDVVRYEPATALFGGHDGLSILRRLCAEVHRYAAAQSCLAIEIGFDQADAVRALLRGDAWGHTDVVFDLQGHPRVVVAKRGAQPAMPRRRDTAPDDQRETHRQDIDAALPVFNIDDAPDLHRTL